MIRMILHNGSVYVWNAEDWHELRSKYRIVGNLVGNTSGLPRQAKQFGLPMMLSEEEVTLILNLGIGSLFSYNDVQPSRCLKLVFQNHRQQSVQQQVDEFREERKRHILGMMDKIIEGKKKKLKLQKKDGQDNDADCPELNQDVILAQELSRVTNTTCFVQSFVDDPWFIEADFIKAHWTYPISELDKLKYKVFKDLWDQGYCLSSGEKFGGHFLVYPGDPTKFHAYYIVKCVLDFEELSFTDLILHARVATSTKKIFVIASIHGNDSKVNYKSFTWGEKT